MLRILLVSWLSLLPAIGWAVETCVDETAAPVIPASSFKTYSELKAHLNAMKSVSGLQDLMMDWPLLPESPEAISGKVKSFVDAYNAALGFIQGQHIALAHFRQTV